MENRIKNNLMLKLVVILIIFVIFRVEVQEIKLQNRTKYFNFILYNIIYSIQLTYRIA